MKPTYTVRLTEELDAGERARIAERVAGLTDIDADKLERLLARGQHKDLIRPSAANVANRLASVLAEAGAPIELVPVGAGADASSAPVPEATLPESGTDADAGPDVEPDIEPGVEHDIEPDVEPDVAHVATEGDLDVEPTAEPAFESAVERSDEPEIEREPDIEPETARGERPPPPEIRGPDVEEPLHRSALVEEPPGPTPEPRGTALLGATGAVLVGIGAVLGMDFLVDPLAIGIIVLAVFALGLSLMGQRRAMWLPGLGALALIVWAIANADGGPMASLAGNWEWYAMLAGALLVIVAGWQEARRNRGL